MRYLAHTDTGRNTATPAISYGAQCKIFIIPIYPFTLFKIYCIRAQIYCRGNNILSFWLLSWLLRSWALGIRGTVYNTCTLNGIIDDVQHEPIYPNDIKRKRAWKIFSLYYHYRYPFIIRLYALIICVCSFSSWRARRFSQISSF